MNPLRPAGPSLPEAAVRGGAVTRETLQDAAGREGREGSEVVRSLLAQSLPSRADLGRAYAAGLPRLDPSLLTLSAKASRLLDAQLLRRERCVPVEILEELCILAVVGPRADAAVEAVRAALRRAVLPGLADAGAIDAILADLEPPPAAVRMGPLPRRDTPVHARFRDLALDRTPFDALPAGEKRS